MGIMNWLLGDPEPAGDGRVDNGGAAPKPRVDNGGAAPKPRADDGAPAPKPRAESAAKTVASRLPDAEPGSEDASGGKSADAAPKAGSAAPRARLGRRALSDGEALETEAMMVDSVGRALDAFARIEAAVQPLVGMLQATAKSAAKSEQDRRQQNLDLRAHITGETDRLAETLRERITQESAIELWRAVAPALDELDHVLREEALGEARGVESVRLVRRKLRDAFSRLGIEEIAVEPRITQFDPHLHEGQPHDGDDAPAGLAAGTVTAVRRTGYVLGDRVLRCALVTVVTMGDPQRVPQTPPVKG